MERILEKANKRYPTAMDEVFPNTQSLLREGFIAGYEQAVKDLTLTREDMRYISESYDKIPYMPQDEFYDEMLKLFNQHKEQ